MRNSHLKSAVAAALVFAPLVSATFVPLGMEGDVAGQSGLPQHTSIIVVLAAACLVLGFMLVRTRKTDMSKKSIGKSGDALETAAKMLDAVAQNHRGVVWSTDKNGVFTICNGQLLKTIGVMPRDVIGKNISEAQRVHNIFSVIKDNFGKMFDYGVQNFSSEINGRTYLTCTSPVCDAAGLAVSVIGITDDTTDSARLNEELVKALKDATSANNTKSAIIASISHEIRTPMNSIVGFAELALDYEIPDAPKDYVNKILDNSKWLLQVINDMFDISKLEEGQASLKLAPFDLRDVFFHCQTITEPIALEKGLGLYFYTEPFVDKKLVGDPIKLAQVFINLVSNAIKYTSTGTIKISAVVKDTADDSVLMGFDVRDSGAGMKNEIIDAILNPQAHVGDELRKYAGAGLGLSIVKGFVELMGGKLSIESTPGIGSKFSFDIRFKTEHVKPGALAAAALQVDDIEMPAFEGEVLICEDNRMNQEVIRRHLERVGLHITIADDGEVGVQMVKNRIARGEKRFDLIIMDINMPIMDGLEASAQIMKLDPKSKIVAMTANVMPGDKEHYEKCGMMDCIGKPFLSRELWKCLRKYLNVIKDDGLYTSLYGEELLRELKTIFVSDNKNAYTDILSAIESGNTNRAHLLAHTLKSSAATIGVRSLQKAAFSIEKTIADGGASAVSKLQLDTLESELNKTLNELSEFSDTQNTEQTPTPQLDAPTLWQLGFADVLEDLLRKGCPDCLVFSDALRAASGCEKLLRQMENFDFDDALETFALLRKDEEARNNG